MSRPALLTSETNRVEAFSDGVFAIAITLLILEIKIPQPGTGQLARQLLQQWPSYISFLISFAFIGVMWVNHHRLFTHIKRCDHNLLMLNLLLLLGVTWVPYPTAVLASHLNQQDQRPAVILFSGTYLFIALAFRLLWKYASSRRRGLLAEDVDWTLVEGISRRYGFGPILYSLCFALAWVNAAACLTLNFALACFFALPPRYFLGASRQ